MEDEGHDIGGKEVGTLVEVHGPVVLIRCDRLPPLQQALTARSGQGSYTFEVYQHLDRQHARAITLEHPAGLRRGMPVYDTGAPLRVPVCPAILGRREGHELWNEMREAGEVLTRSPPA